VTVEQCLKRVALGVGKISAKECFAAVYPCVSVLWVLDFVG